MVNIECLREILGDSYTKLVSILKFLPSNNKDLYQILASSTIQTPSSESALQFSDNQIVQFSDGSAVEW